MSERIQFSGVARFILISAAFVVLVAGIKAADALFIPFLLSLFIAILAAPPLFFLKQKGLPSGLAILVVSLGMVGAGFLLAWMIGGSLNDFTANLPNYQERLGKQSASLLSWLAGFGVVIDSGTVDEFFNPGKAMLMVGKLLSGLGNVLTQAIFILITVIFMLGEATAFGSKLQHMSAKPDESRERIAKITSSINQYMIIKASTSLLTGVLITLWLLFLGVDYPVLWGLVAFLFNFVPNIGSIIAAIPAVLLAVVQLGPAVAAWTIVGYLVVNNVVGNVIEPRYMGKGLGLSPLVVFISLVFWGWILGPVGMFLSVPLTMTVKIAMDAYPESRPISVLLGADH